MKLSLKTCCCVIFLLTKFGHVFLQQLPLNVNSLTSDGFNVKILSWNINEKSPKVDFESLLAVNESAQIPDIYAIGLQEVNPMIAIFDTNERLWIKQLSLALSAHNYLIVSTISIHGSFVIVYIRRESLKKIASVETGYVKRGPIGLLGNKGATAVRLDFAGTSLCFVSSHFQAGDEKLQSRIKDYDAINSKLYFNNPKSKRISNHDLIFWFGDLNFRIDGFSGEQIVKIVKEKDLTTAVAELMNKDQLKNAMKEGTAFEGYIEGTAKFKPTYKYKIGTNEYNLKRKPAFTDRVLYRKKKDSLNVNQITYSSNDEFKISDHKPVSALFTIH